MFELEVDSHFDAAHFLKGYIGDCSRLHGHTWGVTISVRSEDNPDLGMAMDFKDISAKLEQVVSLFDHRTINDLEWFRENNPTAENIARFIFDRLSAEIDAPGRRLASVTVSESVRRRATYRRDGGA